MFFLTMQAIGERGVTMSWMEYSDMWEKAQENGNYKLFVFDLKDSRKQGYFYPRIQLFLYRVYFRIKDLEKERNAQIFHTSEKFNKGDRMDLLEPFFILGDLFGFTVLRGSISDQEVCEIAKETKQELNLPYQFYFSSGFYETDDYGEGGEKYFRGYCIQFLEHQAKKNKIMI